MRRTANNGGDEESKMTTIEDTTIVDAAAPIVESDGAAGLITQSDLFYNLSRKCILLLALLFPFWFFPVTTAPVLFNKIFLVSILVITSFVFYIAHAILQGRVKLVTHKVFAMAGAVIMIWIVSALISQQTYVSLFGSGPEATTVLNVLVLFLMATMIMLLFGEPEGYIHLVRALLTGFAVALLLSVFFSVGGGQFFTGIYKERAFNTIDTWRSAAMAFGFYAMILFPFLLSAEHKSKKLFSAFLLSLIMMSVINVPLVWGIIGFFSVIFLSYAIWQRAVSARVLGISLLLLLASLFGLFSGGALQNIVGVPQPIEVNVSHRATLDIAKNALKEGALFGHGPASFSYLWDHFKPAQVNQSDFWNTRFVSGSSYFLTLLGEVGILGFFAFFSFSAFLWWWSFRAATSPLNEHRIITLSAFTAVSYTMVMWFLFPVGYTLVAFGFFAIGFGMAAMRISNLAHTRELTLFREGPSGFVTALLLVFLIIIGAFGWYHVSARYVSQIAFARGLAASGKGNVDLAERRVNQAARFDSRNNIYSRARSQIAILRAQNFVSANVAPSDLLRTQFVDVLSLAINSGQQSIRLSPLNFENYQSLGKVYEFLIPLGVDGALETALNYYDKALLLAPTNPMLWKDKALSYFAEARRSGNRDFLVKSEEAFRKSIELKPNYTDAHFLLAQVFDAMGNQTEAIRRAEAAAILAPNDTGALFQLGFLYYRTNKFSDAEAILQRAVEINSNYSNARYFLGLVYDRTGRKNKAVEQFEKIQELNPGNAEIKTILANLRAGRPALESITTPPERRGNPPLNENN